jgi:hypothetical protein
MPIYFWPKALAILITKKMRYVLPIIAGIGVGIGAVGGYIFGSRKKKTDKKTKGE